LGHPLSFTGDIECQKIELTPAFIAATTGLPVASIAERLAYRLLRWMYPGYASRTLLRIELMFSRVRLLVAAALVVGGASACSDLIGFDGTADGTYVLYTVNGDDLPYSYTLAGTTYTVLNGTYQLDTDQTYNTSVSLRIADSFGTRTESRFESGDWSQSGNSVTFTPFDSDTGDFATYRATMSNDSRFGGTRTLRTSKNGLTGVYSD
jgi:hypothetical protein